MDNKMILPVENYPDEKVLRLQALKKNNIADDVAVLRDGAEALQLRFCTEAFADRDPHVMPQALSSSNEDRLKCHKLGANFYVGRPLTSMSSSLQSAT